MSYGKENKIEKETSRKKRPEKKVSFSFENVLGDSNCIIPASNITLYYWINDFFNFFHVNKISKR